MQKNTDRQRVPELLVLCQLFYPELVSTGQTLTELCEQLVEFGVDVEVLCAPPTVVDRKVKVPRRMEHKGIKIRRVWGTRLPKLNLIGRIVNQLTFAGSAFQHLVDVAYACLTHVGIKTCRAKGQNKSKRVLRLEPISKLKDRIRQIVWQENVQDVIKYSHEKPVIRCLERLLAA